MKKLILCFISALSAISPAHSQTPDFDVWPLGVVFTDINGNSHDIDEILDSGKSIVIDAFADWCGPCWGYHQSHELENLHQNSGANGTDIVRVFGIEADPIVPEANISNAGTGMGDWTIGVNYPLINDDDLADIINLPHYPTIILICPDRSVTDVGPISESSWVTSINNCQSAPVNTNDVRIIGEKTEGSYLCDGPETEVSLKVAVQNYSNTDINGTYTVRVMDGNTEIATTNASLNLLPYDYEVITVGTSVFGSGEYNLTSEITTANDDLSNDAGIITFENITPEVASTGPNGLTVDVIFDDYGSEFGMAFSEGVPYTDNLFQMYSDFSDNSPAPILFETIGTYSNNDNEANINLPITNDGCHFLTLFDNGFDGMGSGSSITLSSETGFNSSVNTNYGPGTIKVFKITSEAVGLNENSITSFDVFPNPAKENINILFEAENLDYTITISDLQGKILVTKNLSEVNGMQSINMNTSNIENGNYIIKVSSIKGVLYKNISIQK